MPKSIYGETKAKSGNWASILRLVDIQTLETLFAVPLTQNDFAMSVEIVKFASRSELHVLVGCAVDLHLNPRKLKGGAIYTFKLSAVQQDDKQVLQLSFVHRTEVEEAVGAIHSFGGRALVSVGRLARVYDIGHKKLLLKTENRVISFKIWGNYWIHI